MKTRNLILGIALVAGLFFTACEENNVDPKNDYGILPEKFKVDVPNSLSNSKMKSAGLKNAQSDTLNGNEIYQHLNFFIAIGEGAADLVEAIMFSIKVYHIEDVIYLSYTSDEDDRVKNLEVTENAEFQGQTWEYQLTITDAESEGNADGGIGMQVFWNNSPIDGIAIIKPYNLNRTENQNASEAVFSIEYSETGMGKYESYMIVGISGLPLPAAIEEPYALRAMKMFVGKDGDEVDVYGNSSHPNAKFFTDDIGFNWAFVASGNQTSDIAVAEVGLPPCSLDATSREIILGDYSVKNVFTEAINEWFFDTFGIHPDSTDLAGYLKNADAPGYFNSTGFIQGGTAPGSDYAPLETRIEELVPYNPTEITNLQISFK